MKPSELLRKKGWCQRVIAIDLKGNMVHEDDDRACAYCMSGAVYHCIKDRVYLLKYLGTLSNILFKRFGVGVITEVNDEFIYSKLEAIIFLEETEKELEMV